MDRAPRLWRKPPREGIRPRVTDGRIHAQARTGPAGNLVVQHIERNRDASLPDRHLVFRFPGPCRSRRRAGWSAPDDRAGDGRPGLDRIASGGRLVGLGRQARAIPAQAPGQRHPRHFPATDHGRGRPARRRSRTRQARCRRSGLRQPAPAHGVRAQWRRVPARPAQWRTGAVDPQRRGGIPAPLRQRWRRDLARGQPVVSLDRYRRSGAGRTGEGGEGSPRQTQARCVARPATADAADAGPGQGAARWAADPE